MPIFEYRCGKCGHEFEQIVGSSGTAECPKCGSGKLDKKFSVFAAQTGGSAKAQAPAMPCGMCGDPRGAGSCQFD